MDAVSDILTVNTDDILPVPIMDRTVDEAFLTGLVTVKKRMVALLKLENLFDPDSIPKLEPGDVSAPA